MSAHGSVGFRWGTITGPYHANFSQVETQKFDPHWFIVFNGGVTTFFAKSVYLGISLLCSSSYGDRWNQEYLYGKRVLRKNKTMKRENENNKNKD